MRTALLTPARLAKLLAAVTVALVVLNLLLTLYTNEAGQNSLPDVAAALDHGTQWNIPSIFLALMLLLSAGIAAFIGIEDVSGRLRVRLGWLGLSLVMGYLCLKGLFPIDQAIAPIITAKLSGIHIGWIGPIELIAAVTTVLFLAFLYHLPNKTALLLLLGGVMFIAGAIDVAGFAQSWGLLGSSFVKAIDVALQMAGLVVIAPTMLGVLEEVDETNAVREAAARHVHPRVAIDS